ncbi:MAG: MotA/TolQ/ExbB proton channel family protein [Firmicutes bacterium]|jgi:biopolymer transport protein ExbB|nr:MotA/TolQ/ExbB proton channel family protein [Bacillota bacterium]
MMDIVLKGGPVMIPLLFSSVLALAVGLERLIYLWRSRVDTEDLMDDIKLALQQGKVLEAMQIAKKSRGPVAAILAAGIAQYDRPREEIRQHLEEVGAHELYKMERRMVVLDSIVTIAPLLGLLGTVTGIMRSFNVLAAMQGAHSPEALSYGIAEALITTAAGLIIAIPAMALYYYLSSLIDRNVAEMNRRSADLLYFLETRGDG